MAEKYPTVIIKIRCWQYVSPLFLCVIFSVINCTKLSGAGDITKCSQLCRQWLTLWNYIPEILTIFLWHSDRHVRIWTMWSFFISDIYHLKITWTVSTFLNNDSIIISELGTSDSICLFRSLGLRKLSSPEWRMGIFIQMSLFSGAAEIPFIYIYRSEAHGYIVKI